MKWRSGPCVSVRFVSPQALEERTSAGRIRTYARTSTVNRIKDVLTNTLPGATPTTTAGTSHHILYELPFSLPLNVVRDTRLSLHHDFIVGW